MPLHRCSIFSLSQVNAGVFKVGGRPPDPYCNPEVIDGVVHWMGLEVPIVCSQRETCAKCASTEPLKFFQMRRPLAAFSVGEVHVCLHGRKRCPCGATYDATLTDMLTFFHKKQLYLVHTAGTKRKGLLHTPQFAMSLYGLLGWRPLHILCSTE